MTRRSFVSTWRRLVLNVAACALACGRETPTGQPNSVSYAGQLRATLPRLSGLGLWRACTHCGAANIPPHLVSIRVGECDHVMNSEADAVQLLAYVPHCTDAAVEKLAA